MENTKKQPNTHPILENGILIYMFLGFFVGSTVAGCFEFDKAKTTEKKHNCLWQLCCCWRGKNPKEEFRTDISMVDIELGV